MTSSANPAFVTAQEAEQLMREGAVLVDIRETEERTEMIPGALHMPLSAINHALLPVEAGRRVLFHCRSGRRTTMNAEALAAKAGDREVCLLDGGIDGWAAAGLPVTRNA
jgi:rhodanese-related sulfurtransferase